MSGGEQIHVQPAPSSSNAVQTFSPDLSRHAEYFDGHQTPSPMSPIPQVSGVDTSPIATTFPIDHEQVPLQRLPSHSGPSVYSSSTANVQFVNTYDKAVAACMTQDKVSRRDPRIVGKLIVSVIKNIFIRYWFFILAVVAFVLLVHFLGAGFLLPYTPLLLPAFLILKLVQMPFRITTELTPNVPMHSFQFYKLDKLISRARFYLPVARAFSGLAPLTQEQMLIPPPAQLSADILFQPSEGYCGQATLNNVLASIRMQMQHRTTSPVESSQPSLQQQLQYRRFFVTLPPVLRPFSLIEMEKYMRELMRASNVLNASIAHIECLYGWQRNKSQKHAGMNGHGYRDFLLMLQQQANDPRYRFMINFLRTPLFFCEEAPSPQRSAVNASKVLPSKVSLGRKLFSGHWSPLLGYLAPQDIERFLAKGGSGATPPYVAIPPTTPAAETPVPLSSPSPDASPNGGGSVSSGNLAETLTHFSSPAELSAAEQVAASAASPTTQPDLNHASLPSKATEPCGLRNRNSGHTPPAGSTPNSSPSFAACSSSSVPIIPPYPFSHPMEPATIGDGLLLVADVNPSYGYYLIPPRRLYDAVETINLLDGGPRGMLRVTLNAPA